MDWTTVDWNALWLAGQPKRHEQRRNPRNWDKRAKEFSKAASKGDYPRQLQEIMRPEPDWTVLDMGCAAGTLAVPLSRVVKSVTAADPSTGMRELLQEQCASEGIKNIRIADAGWESDWEVPEVGGAHDVVLGSRSLLVKDLRASLQKANHYAKKKVVLTVMAGDGPHDRRVLEAVGREFNPGPDYIIVVNLLRTMGICAEVTFTQTRPRERFDSLDEALKELSWMVRDMDSTEEDRLREWLGRTLEPVPGGWLLPSRPLVRWAVLSWEPRLAGNALFQF